MPAALRSVIVAVGPTVSSSFFTAAGGGGGGGGGWRRRRVAGDEGAVHRRRVRVADERVATFDERHGPGDRPGVFDLGEPVDAGAGEMEVVLDIEVADDDVVDAGIDLRDDRAVRVGQADEEARADGGHQLRIRRRRARAGGSENEHRGGGESDETPEAHHLESTEGRRDRIAA